MAASEATRPCPDCGWADGVHFLECPQRGSRAVYHLYPVAAPPAPVVEGEPDEWAHLYQSALMHDHMDIHGATVKNLIDQLRTALQSLREKEARIVVLEATLNTPETDDFFKGIELEAAHQRQRWPSEHDAGKEPQDWFWLVGYLAGKCLASHIARKQEKALHHTISTAAALANWHRAIKGAGNMRPGIDTPDEARQLESKG